MILTTTGLEYFVRLAIFNIDQPFQDGIFKIELFILKLLVGFSLNEVIFQRSCKTLVVNHRLVMCREAGFTGLTNSNMAR